VLHDGETSLVGGLRALFPEANVIEFKRCLSREADSTLYVWRALYFVRTVFEVWEYERVLFVTGTFVVLSDKMFNYIGAFRSGWVGFSHPRHTVIESGLQVVTRDCGAFWAFTSNGTFRAHTGDRAENALPYCEVNREMCGDFDGERPREHMSTRGAVDYWVNAAS